MSGPRINHGVFFVILFTAFFICLIAAYKIRTFPIGAAVTNTNFTSKLQRNIVPNKTKQEVNDDRMVYLRRRGMLHKKIS